MSKIDLAEMSIRVSDAKNTLELAIEWLLQNSGEDPAPAVGGLEVAKRELESIGDAIDKAADAQAAHNVAKLTVVKE